MCEHEGREHRTSPCYLCRVEKADGGVVSGGQLGTFIDPYSACPPQIVMPLLWDGDNS